MRTNERRKHPRAPARFRLRLDSTETCEVRDISLSGVRCICVNRVSPMTVVGLRIQVPSEGGPSEVSGEGVVVRCRELEDAETDGFDLAIFFQGIDEDGRRVIEDYVQSHSNSQAD